MSKSPITPITPNTPKSAERGLFRIFSRQNFRKDKQVGAVPIHISQVPLPQTPLQLGFPNSNRSNRTYPNNHTGQKFPPKLRANVQLERAPNPQPCTAVLEKFPNPSIATSTRDPLPSVRSLHNLHERKVQNTPHNMHYATQELSNSRHKRHLGDLKDLQTYLQNITQSTPAVGVRPPIDASSDTFTRDIDLDKGSPVLSSSSSYSSDDDESIQATTSDGMTLDDYPWYFVAVVDDASLLYGLSPVAPRHFGDLKEMYIFDI